MKVWFHLVNSNCVDNAKSWYRNHGAIFFFVLVMMIVCIFIDRRKFRSLLLFLSDRYCFTARNHRIGLFTWIVYFIIRCLFNSFYSVWIRFVHDIGLHFSNKIDAFDISTIRVFDNKINALYQQCHACHFLLNRLVLRLSGNSFRLTVVFYPMLRTPPTH